jgi:anti-sigma regulatory factor (Ser/Thr protein kinase)
MTEGPQRKTKGAQWHGAVFQPTPRSVKDARRFVASLVTQPEARETGELLVSELTTNALCHAGGPFEVRVQAEPRLRVEVRDRSHRWPAVKDADPTDEGGRGLHIVRQLAKAWGTEERPDGKVVWFEL